MTAFPSENLAEGRHGDLGWPLGALHAGTEDRVMPLGG